MNLQKGDIIEFQMSKVGSAFIQKGDIGYIVDNIKDQVYSVIMLENNFYPETIKIIKKLVWHFTHREINNSNIKIIGKIDTITYLKNICKKY